MKRLHYLCLFLAAWVYTLRSVAYEPIVVNFESGIPTGWTANGVTIKKDGNSMRAAMSTGATLVSPEIGHITAVSYKHRGSGNGKRLTVEKTTDGGSTWEEVGEVSVSSSSAYGTSGHTVNASASDNVRLKFTCQSATIFLDDIEIEYVNLADEPLRQGAFRVEETTGKTVSVKLSAGDGEGRMLAYTRGSSFGWEPTDGESFAGPFPKHTDNGNVTIVASGNDETATVTGLEPGETYTFALFEYNGAGDTRNYLTQEAPKETVTTPTVPTIILSREEIDFKKTKVGNSKERTVTLGARYLNPETGNLNVESQHTAITLSTDGTNYTDRLTLPYDSAGLRNTDIIVRFTPSEFKPYETNIVFSTGETQAVLTISGIGSETENHEYYLSPDGDDENGAGSFERPWQNLQKAVNMAVPGDVIYCRGGRYRPNMRDNSGKLTVRIKTSGTPEAPITIRNYADESPIFDFEQQLTDCGRDRSKVGDRGILITGNYWHLYGLHITHAADNGIKLEGSHNRIERCEFSYNLDTGLQLGFGHDFSDSGYGSKNDGSYCAYNDIIDCDSHHNCDFDTNYGSDADGFACKMHNGKENRFIRCRAWRNSDDAWDLYETDFSVTLIECWAWESGNAEDHTWVLDYFEPGPNFSGNGNGIKLGGNGTGGSSMGVHYAYNCIAFGCDKSGSTKGFDCNNHKGGHVIVGGLAFDNGYDFMFESGGGANSEFYNNVCFGRQEILVGKESHNAFLGTPQQGKTFYNQVITSFGRNDYESLSESDALAPRGSDGSLPTRFARLKSGSRLVDAGIHKPLPYTDEFPDCYQPIYGNARDLGPYELQEGAVSSAKQTLMTHRNSSSFSIMKGRHNREAIAHVSSRNQTEAFIRIIDLTGTLRQTVACGMMESGADYYIPFGTQNLSAGTYICQIQLGEEILSGKMVITGKP